MNVKAILDKEAKRRGHKHWRIFIGVQQFGPTELDDTISRMGAIESAARVIVDEQLLDGIPDLFKAKKAKIIVVISGLEETVCVISSIGILVVCKADLPSVSYCAVCDYFDRLQWGSAIRICISASLTVFLLGSFLHIAALAGRMREIELGHSLSMADEVGLGAFVGLVTIGFYVWNRISMEHTSILYGTQAKLFDTSVINKRRTRHAGIFRTKIVRWILAVLLLPTLAFIWNDGLRPYLWDRLLKPAIDRLMNK